MGIGDFFSNIYDKVSEKIDEAKEKAEQRRIEAEKRRKEEEIMIYLNTPIAKIEFSMGKVEISDNPRSNWHKLYYSLKDSCLKVLLYPDRLRLERYDLITEYGVEERTYTIEVYDPVKQELGYRNYIDTEERTEYNSLHKTYRDKYNPYEYKKGYFYRIHQDYNQKSLILSSLKSLLEEVTILQMINNLPFGIYCNEVTDLINKELLKYCQDLYDQYRKKGISADISKQTALDKIKSYKEKIVNNNNKFNNDAKYYDQQDKIKAEALKKKRDEENRIKMAEKKSLSDDFNNIK